MTRAEKQRLIAMHGRHMDDCTRLLRAAEREADDNRRGQIIDDAAECKGNAEAIAAALAGAAPDVDQPVFGQLALVGLL